VFEYLTNQKRHANLAGIIVRGSNTIRPYSLKMLFTCLSIAAAAVYF